MSIIPKAFVLLALILLVSARPASGQGAVQITPHRYPNVVRVQLEGTSEIVTVSFRNYIKGVVQGEIGSFILASNLPINQSIEAYKAQAIAAATFFEGKKRSGEPFDITNTTADQKYVAFDAGTFSVIGSAVDQLFPEGQNGSWGIITYNGSNIKAFFFGHNSGENLNSEDSRQFKSYDINSRSKYVRDVNTNMAADGHGVGLSQAGIRHFAQRGQSYQDIIRFYYQPRPPFLAKVIAIQDINENENFDDDPLSFESSWIVDQSGNWTSMSRTISSETALQCGYYTKFVLFFSEQMDDGGTKPLTMQIGGQRVIVRRITTGSLGNSIAASDNVNYGAIESGTGIGISNISEFDFKVAIGVLAPSTLEEAQRNDSSNLVVSGFHRFNNWILDSDPSSRAWANINGSLERYTPGNDEGNVLQLGSCGTQVSFVIDDTGSMSEEIGSVTSSLVRYIDTFPESSTTTFQLTTFKDGVSTRSPTDSLDEIRGQVASLRASGGGGCPESSLRATREAAASMEPNSTLSLFTDASPNGGQQELNALIRNLRSRGIRANAVLSGDCVNVPGVFRGNSNDGSDIQPTDSYFGDYRSNSSGGISGIEAYSLLTRETGGLFAFIPEVNESEEGRIRYENASLNILRGGISESISLMNPSFAPQGSTVISTITGSNTNFRPGTTLQIEGINVLEITVTSPVEIIATLEVPELTDVGFIDVSAITNLGGGITEVATGIGSFQIVDPYEDPTISSVSPNFARRGDNLDVVITSVNTSFSDSSVVNMGDNVAINGITIDSPNQLSANISISEFARVGFRSILIQTGSEIASEDVFGPFFVGDQTPEGIPIASSISPRSGAPGSTIDVQIEGRNITFTETEPSVFFSGEGISVRDVSESNSLVSATIEIASDSQPGFRDVRLSTDSGIAVLLGGFLVTDLPDSLGEGLVLSQNYPNPFNGSTTIRYQIPDDGKVVVDVLDLLGRQVAVLYEGDQTAGVHEVEWSPSETTGQILSGSLYICRIVFGGETKARPLTFLR